VLKDFLWWILKDNYLTNYFYIKVFPLFFKSRVDDLALENSPVINKDVARGLYKTSKTKFALKGYTSGTTNSPFTVFRSIKSVLLEEYIIKSYLFDSGVPIKAKIAVLRGDRLSGTKIMVKMPFTDRVIFSSYQISEQTAQQYFNALETYKPDVVMAFPSSVVILAKYARKFNWKPNWPLVGVFTSSETFTKDNQEIVKSVFGNVFDHYGQAERVAALQLCSEGNYHTRDDYSHIEFITTEHGISIVGSNYHNKAMPLLRYDTQDLVEGLNSDGHCKCGNTSTYVTRILGRNDDYILLPNGGQVGRLGVVFKDIQNLIECQLEQVLIDKLIIRYVIKVGTSSSELENVIRKGLEERLGKDINFFFEKLTGIPRTKAGKFQTVIRNKDIIHEKN
jgi:phenylacetate-CoA ligase